MTGPTQDATLMRAIDDAASRPAYRSTREWSGIASDEFEDRPKPRMDQAILEETLAYLPQEEIVGHFQLLRGRMDQILLRLVDQEDTLALLAETAHSLAAIAGMFGFQALSVVSRRIGRAVAHNAPELQPLLEQLDTETHAALSILGELELEIRRRRP